MTANSTSVLLFFPCYLMEIPCISENLSKILNYWPRFIFGRSYHERSYRSNPPPANYHHLHTPYSFFHYLRSFTSTDKYVQVVIAGFSGIAMSSLWRLVELILGQILTILAVMFIIWGVNTLVLDRVEGKEIDNTSKTSKLVVKGAYAYCRRGR